MNASARPAHMLTNPLRWVLTRFRSWIRERAWRTIHDTSIYRGISLHRHFKAPDDAVQSIAAALDRIADVDPVSFARIPRLLPGGIVADVTDYATAWYSNPRKACVIGATALRLDTTDDLALCILHEMCHARLLKQGIGYDTPKTRLRHEQIAIRRELAFARKLEARDITPGYYTDWLAEKLSSVADNDYTDDSFLRRRRREYLQRLRLLRQLNVPRWLRRLVVMKARRRWQKQKRLAAVPRGTIQ